MANTMKTKKTDDPAPSPRTNGDAVPEPVPVAKDQDSLQSVGEIRILVVDDDATVCRLIKAALAPFQFAIDTVSNPNRMEGQLRQKPYHLVLLDFVIPGLGSDQLLSWVRELQPDASIVVMTAFPSIDSALCALRARTYDYLTKPFDMEALKRVVTRCLESKGLLRLSEERLRESVGAAIRERRKALGLTLKEMSDRTSLSLGYLSQIELGKNSASIETLYRISLGLGIHMADLFQSIQAPV
jgi:DNA-binding response OmpR family regulator